MTGAGTSRFRVGNALYTIEIRSVNSRHPDVKLRLPWAAPALEVDLLSAARAGVHRGRLDIVISNGDGAPEGQGDGLAARCRLAHAQLATLAGELGTPAPTLGDVLAFVARDGEGGSGGRPPEGFAASALAAMPAALTDLDAMRLREGEAMARALLDLVVEAGAQVDAIESLVREQPRRVAERMAQRVAQLLADLGQARDAVDAGRLTAEVALLADRLDVTEELIRLRSHFAQFRTLVAGPAPQGRKLDFLTQELNREANTIGSKCQDSEAAVRVVELKAIIEKVREVVQNVE
jgi:uncharacterized protein YicC (UPF0701 family)